MSIDFLKFKNISKIWGSEKIFELNFIKKNKFNILKVITIKKKPGAKFTISLKKERDDNYNERFWYSEIL